MGVHHLGLLPIDDMICELRALRLQTGPGSHLDTCMISLCVPLAMCLHDVRGMHVCTHISIYSLDR